MSTLKEFIEHKPKLTSFLLELLAGIVTVGCFLYQDKTGPTYPLEGAVDTVAGFFILNFCVVKLSAQF